MKQFEASIHINAAPDKIWGVLLETAAYPEWDLSYEKIEGECQVGNKLKVFSKLSPGRAFPVKVAELTTNERMVWTGGMPLGLFKGVRRFTLTPDGEGVQFRLHEIFTGPMVKLIGGALPDLTENFEGFVAGLKKRVEA